MINMEDDTDTPSSSLALSNLDIVNNCDSFPYPHSHPTLHARHLSTYYFFRIKGSPSVFGYVLPSVAEVFRGLTAWEVDDDDRTLTLIEGDDYKSRTAAIERTTTAMRETGHFAVLKGWRDELYPIWDSRGDNEDDEDAQHGADGQSLAQVDVANAEGTMAGRRIRPKKELVFSMERSASPLFGIVTYGCHMTVYQNDPDGLKIWTPRRAKTKQTYPGAVDNSVAGGIATGETAWECLVREAAEEASLPEDLTRRKAKSVGIVTYFHVRNARAGGEQRLLQPEAEYVYDMDITGEDVTPKPSDDEVMGFELLTIDQIKERMARGELKDNSALVILDFFIRHGVLTPENEPDYIEIQARLHRKLEFPIM